jgi:hypothetical protein
MYGLNSTRSAIRVGRITRRSGVTTCEALESRRLLAIYTYVVPFGHSVAYIEDKSQGFPGQLQVRLDSPTADPVSPNPFENRPI